MEQSSIQSTTWGGARRAAAAGGGFVLFVVSLVLGATIVASGAVGELIARALVITLLTIALLGLYISAAGIWGGWSPACSTSTRIRSVRIALVWAILVGAYMCYGLPLGSPRGMSAAEWTSVAILAALLAISIFSVVCIRSRPRAVVAALGVAAAYGLFMTLKFLLILLWPTRSFGGPAVAVTFVLVGSFGLALVFAFALAWPLRASAAGPFAQPSSDAV